MYKMKLQIELNKRPYGEDMIYAAVSFRGGYITRNYIIDDTNHFVSNCAFYNVLFNKAKQTTRDAFTMRYKDGAFRSKYKGYEFSDLNKRFTLKELIEDLDKITYEDFVKSAKTLIVPGNVCIYVSGNINERDFSLVTLENYEEQFLHKIRIAGYGYDPFLRQDAHITNKAREDHNLIIEAIDFLNDDCTNFTKMIITELLAEQVPAHEIDIWVDSLDASIMFSSEQLRGY